MPKHEKQVTSGEDFQALPAAEKERIFRELDRLTADQIKAARPLTAKEKRRHFQPPRKVGRPKLGKNGTEIISVSLEKGLLKQADALAKAKGMKRSELVATGIRLMLRESA